jgi:nitric oxide reductase NorD protein
MMSVSTPYTAEEMEEKLDQFLDPVLSFRRTAAAPARKLSRFKRKQQDNVLHWVEVIAATNAEMAYQYADKFPEAMQYLHDDLDAVECWIIEAITAFDEKGLQLSIQVLHNAQFFAEKYWQKQYGIQLDGIKKLLGTFICGLSGRDLKIATHDFSYTDTESIFLPELISEFKDKETNFLYYKLLAVFNWAQTWYGTWCIDPLEMFSQQSIPAEEHQNQALKLFQIFESIRLIACIKNELPGFYRQVQPLIAAVESLPQSAAWSEFHRKLEAHDATAHTTIQLVNENYNRLKGELLNLKIFPFSGIFQPEKVLQIKLKRILDEKDRFRIALAKIAAEKKALDIEEPLPLDQMDEPVKFEFMDNEDDEFQDGFSYELMLDGQPVAPPEDTQSLMESIIQDIGIIPEEYLVAAGPGKYNPDHTVKEKKSDDVWSGIYHEEGAWFYDEWDHVRQHYRKNWCVVREVRVAPVYDDFVVDTLQRYMGIVKSLRRNFEALRGEEKLLKRQQEGDDIDIDAVVEAYADLQHGAELNSRVFTRMQRVERNIAVMFMVDMSGSTRGWINQAEREALVLLCESLEMLGDRYAIYGFSGIARKRCEIFHIKHMDEEYNNKVKARISGISAKDYTRMGFAIRHLTSQLEEVEARTKLLITLSDGKPEDYDGQYRGEYGIEDTRQALFECREKGIHPYCITIDKEAGDYLPHMYGAANYVLIEDITKLPIKVADIYRKLTS